MRAWSCIDFPSHGSFTQSTLDKLGPKAEVAAELNVAGRPGERGYQRLADRQAAGEKALRRYACPVCLAIAAKTGKPHSGAWLRPATEADLAHQGGRVMATGDRFGRYVVIGEASRNSRGQRQFNVRCDCGVERVVLEYNLKNGNSRSCGCLAADLTSDRERTHGACPQRGGKRRNAPEYNSWFGMIQRCENPNTPNFRHYGGRGVTVCPEWRRSFHEFLRDVGPRPSSRHTIDRIDVNGNYEPGNVRWADPITQQNNRRNTGSNRKEQHAHG